MHDTYYLVAIVDNEYIDSNLYAFFERALGMLKANADAPSL